MPDTYDEYTQAAANRDRKPAEVWTEWGVRRTWGAVGTIAPMYRRDAEKCAREWPGELVSRTVHADHWTTATQPTREGNR